MIALSLRSFLDDEPSPAVPVERIHEPEREPHAGEDAILAEADELAAEGMLVQAEQGW